MRKRALVVLMLMLGATACTDSGITPGSGRTQVLITDDPFPFGDIARVDLYIDKIEASTSLDTIGGGDWILIAQPEKSYNLLDFQSGATALAGEVDLPAGQYRAIRVTINTSQSHLVRVGGAEAMVHWPVNGMMSLYAYVENALDVPEGGTQIILDFDVGRTFLVLPTFAPPTEFVFSPWIRAINATGTGSIGGTVTGPDIEGNATPIPDAVVILMTKPGILAAPAVIGSSRTDENGHYKLAYVREGDYGVTVQAPPFMAFVSGTVTAHVSAGSETAINFALERSTGGTDTSGIDTSGVSPGGPVASVSLRIGTPSASTSLLVCDSAPVIADLRNAGGQTLMGRAVSWFITDSTVVSLEGLFGPYAHLRARKAGSATLTATSEGKTATLTFTVSGSGSCGGGGGGGGGVAVATVTLNPVNAAVGDSVGVYANLKGAGGETLSGRAVTWSISDTTVVRFMGTFGQSAVLRALKVGTATLTAVSEGKSGSASVTVH